MIPKTQRRDWTEADDIELKSLAKQRTPARAIAKSLNRSLAATRQRAVKLGVSLGSHGGLRNGED